MDQVGTKCNESLIYRLQFIFDHFQIFPLRVEISVDGSNES